PRTKLEFNVKRLPATGFTTMRRIHNLRQQLIRRRTTFDNSLMSSTSNERRMEFVSRLKRIDNWLSRAQPARFDVNVLAKLCRVSPGHLRRFFRVQFGFSPQSWLNEVRLWEAARLVCEGLSLKEVSFELGFADVAHFCRAFKRYHGCTPSQFASCHHIR